MMNQSILILVSMIFCHVIDDYVLQSFSLCNLKQRSWWEANASERSYRFDYLVGLLMHSISWGFMIMLPIIITMKGQLDWIWILLPINTAIHFLVDDLKANRKKINLIVDQSIHLIQILITWLVWMIIC
jgi:hypothetical protein